MTTDFSKTYTSWL